MTPEERIRKGLWRIRVGTAIGVVYVVIGIVMMFHVDDWRLSVLFLIAGVGLTISGGWYLTEFQYLVKQQMLSESDSPVVYPIPKRGKPDE